MKKKNARLRIEKYTQYIRNRLKLSSPIDIFKVAKTIGIKLTKDNQADYDAKLVNNCILFDSTINKSINNSQ